MTIGDRLRAWREHRGYSQAQIACYLELEDKGSISRWERGTRRPTGYYLQRVQDLMERADLPRWAVDLRSKTA